MLYFLHKTIQVRSEIAEEDEEDEELNVKKMKSKQKDKYVLCYCSPRMRFFNNHVIITLLIVEWINN